MVQLAIDGLFRPGQPTQLGAELDRFNLCHAQAYRCGDVIAGLIRRVCPGGPSVWGHSFEEGCMRHAPSCPLHLGLLDSPDYWTDNALVATVRPLSADEWHRLATGSQTQQQRQRRNNPFIE